jgi:hypothetical protein
MTKARRTDYKREYREADLLSGWLLRKIVVWAVAIAATTAVLSLVWVQFVQPRLLSGEGRASRGSYQYTEGQRAVLLRDLTACQQLDTEMATLRANIASPAEDQQNRDADNQLLDSKQRQRAGLLADMRFRIGLMGDKLAVPQEVTDYLSRAQAAAPTQSP